MSLQQEIRALVRYHRRKNRLLEQMKETESIFVHIPKTGGKSVFKLLYGIGLHESFGHASVQFYRSVLGPRKFNRYFKFAFVRDPLERLYSAYRFGASNAFGLEKSKAISTELSTIRFEDFVLHWLTPEKVTNGHVLFRPQYSFLSDENGELLIDRLCRFECFSSEIESICDRLDLPYSDVHINRSQKATYEYTDLMIERVRQLYARDFDLVGFEVGQ